MSKPFLYAVIAVLTAGLGFFVWLHHAEIALIDSMLRCVASTGIWA